MRVPVALAALVIAGDIGYRATQGKSVGARNLIAWGVVIITLAALGLSPFATLADILSYIIITVIILNDGYDVIRGF